MLSLLTLGVYKQPMTDGMCGLCVSPDKLCVCACRRFTSPPCLSPAPVQTCLPRACPWRVHCPVSKQSASGCKQSFHKAEDKKRWTATQRGVADELSYIRKGIVVREVLCLIKVYNLTNAYTFGHTDTHAVRHSFDIYFRDVLIRIFLVTVI